MDSTIQLSSLHEECEDAPNLKGYDNILTCRLPKKQRARYYKLVHSAKSNPSKRNSYGSTKRYCTETISSKMKKYDYDTAGWNNSLETPKPHKSIRRNRTHPIQRATERNLMIEMSFVNEPNAALTKTGPKTEIGYADMASPQTFFHDRPTVLWRNIGNQSSNNTASPDMSPRDLGSAASNNSSIKMYGMEILMGTPWYCETSISKNLCSSPRTKPGVYLSKARTRSLDRKYIACSRECINDFQSPEKTDTLENQFTEEDGNEVFDEGSKLENKPCISLVRLSKSNPDDVNQILDEIEEFTEEDFMEFEEEFLEEISEKVSIDDENLRDRTPEPNASSHEENDTITTEDTEFYDKSRTKSNKKYWSANKQQDPNIQIMVPNKQKLLTCPRVRRWYKYIPADLSDIHSWSASSHHGASRIHLRKHQSMKFVRTPLKITQTN